MHCHPHQPRRRRASAHLARKPMHCRFESKKLHHDRSTIRLVVAIEMSVPIAAMAATRSNLTAFSSDDARLSLRFLALARTHPHTNPAMGLAQKTNPGRRRNPVAEVVLTASSRAAYTLSGARPRLVARHTSIGAASACGLTPHHRVELSRWWCTAKSASSRRFDTPTLLKMFVRWCLTVFSLIANFSAISLF